MDNNDDVIIEVKKSEQPLHDIYGFMDDIRISYNDDDKNFDLPTNKPSVETLTSPNNDLLNNTKKSFSKDKVEEDIIFKTQKNCIELYNSELIKLNYLTELSDNKIDNSSLNHDDDILVEKFNAVQDMKYQKNHLSVLPTAEDGSEVKSANSCNTDKNEQVEFKCLEIPKHRLSVVKKSLIMQNTAECIISESEVNEGKVRNENAVDSKNNLEENQSSEKTRASSPFRRRKGVRLAADVRHNHPVFPEDILAAYDIIDRKEVKEIKPTITSKRNISFINRFKTVFSQNYSKDQKIKSQQKSSMVHNNLVIKLSLEKANDGEPMQVITMSHSVKPENNNAGSSMFIYVDDEFNSDEENGNGLPRTPSDADSDRSSIFNEDDDTDNIDMADSCRSYVVNQNNEVNRGVYTAKKEDVFYMEKGYIKQDSLSYSPTKNQSVYDVEKQNMKNDVSKRTISTSSLDIKSIANDFLRYSLTLPSRKKSSVNEPLRLFTDGFPASLPAFPSDRRSLIALEVYTTERSYVRGLEIVVLHFMKQIGLNGFMDDSELKIVFGNIESILALHKEMLDELLERISNWSDSQSIGDIFLMQENKWKIYSDYCTNYDASDAFLKQRLKKKKDFETFLNMCYTNPVCLPGLTMPSYLITVIQRIPRYVLLLKDIAKRTSSDHNDFQHLKDALALMEKIASFLNEQLKQSQCQKALELLQTQITGLKAYYTPDRNLVHEGAVCLQTSKKTYQCVLFNDLLVFAVKVANRQSIVELALGLKTVWIEDLEGLDPQTTKKDAIGIHTPGRSYIMYVGSNSEKKIWLEKLTKAILQHLYGFELNESNDIDLRETSFEYDDGSVYSGFFLGSKRHREGTMMWPNQMTYKGEWEDDERNGYGTLEYTSGELYEGQWKNDKQDGFGTFIDANGDSVSCKWKNGQRHGEAIINYKNGDVFNGFFVNDNIEGIGELKCINGLYYKGKWRRNLKHGKGNLKLPDGSEYSGYFYRDKYHGKGKLTYSNGSYYTGDFERGERCGEGSYIIPGGVSYVGQWMHDMKNGKGKMTYENGDEYDGTWYQDMRIGQGVLFYNYGGFYRGQWQNDLMHGTGVIEYKDGSTYDGEWDNNKMCGHGKVKYPGGTCYTGAWKDNFPNGKGILTKASGWSCDGNWVQGKQEGQCKLCDPSNNYEYDGQWLNGLKEGKGVEVTKYSTYVGEFIEDLRNGQGLEKYLNGTTYEGTWSHGQKHGKGIKKLVNGLSETQRWSYGVLESSCVLLSPRELPSLQRF
ncbi:uncharacterized protein LOC100200535 isoform X2 [Hydra vulgaris]|uniref:Uncharacterized protein LOC100200535 isoform X2 n=1 Tax=Hydra vulgaris TaxID=6087 RepID=A0ABM4D3S9_HYDVU